jgi:hypothetical protein
MNKTWLIKQIYAGRYALRWFTLIFGIFVVAALVGSCPFDQTPSWARITFAFVVAFGLLVLWGLALIIERDAKKLRD